MNMVEVKTAELSGAALDWAVAKACGFKLRHQVRGPGCGGFHAVGDAYGYIWSDTFPDEGMSAYGWSPSRKWADGGPLIEKYAIEFDWFSDATIRAFTMIDSGVGFGAGHLVAACRAIVDAKLGEVVQVPAELVQEARA